MKNKANFADKIIPSLLVCLFFVALLPYASALFDQKDDQPSQVSTVAKSMVIGEELSFQTDDILAKVKNADEVDGLIICDLPNPEVGTLKFGGRDMISGEAVTIEGIESLKFVPSTSAESKATFTVVPVYKSGGTHAAVNVNINVLSEQNSAPTTENLEIKTAKNIAISGTFKAVDPEGDSITYSIADQPKLGQVEVCLDAPNKFLYTPYQNKSGKDSFTYIATDKLGNASAPATVTVKIEKSKVKLTYADMEGNGVHYQAIALADKGVFQGETIGDTHFLHPSQPVTRSEFIAMTMALFDLDDKASAVSNTGFIDDADTPVWAKPYIVSAVKAGIVQGSPVNGQMELRPQDIITRGEAAVIINNAIELSDVKEHPTFADDASIPTWAKQATANVAQLDIMTYYADRTIRPTVTLTREDAVEILYNAMCAKK